MQKGEKALNYVGMPKCHGQQFLRVAEAEKTIIMSRASGKYARQLIEEGYASKGFHNKAKSCNWGPMAGFVNVNPLFSKAGLTAKSQKSQVKSIQKAFKVGAQSINLAITDARRQELVNMGLLREVSDKDLEVFQEVGKLRGMTPVCYKYEPIMTHTKGDSDLIEAAKGHHFFLKERFFRKGDGPSEWESAFTNTMLPKIFEVYYNTPDKRGAYLPVKTFVDPNFKNLNMDDHESDLVKHLYATTADFDLFSVWADVRDVRKEIERLTLDGKATEAGKLEEASKKLDMRPASTFTLFDYASTEKHEDPYEGNITPRLTIIKNALNQAFITSCNYQMGNLVHHSDEAGRPHIDDVDYPVIVFVPKGNDVATKYGQVFTIDGTDSAGKNPTYERVKSELKALVKDANKAGFRVGLNPGWVKELGTEYREYALPSDPKANPFYKHYKEPTAVS